MADSPSALGQEIVHVAGEAGQKGRPLVNVVLRNHRRHNRLRAPQVDIRGPIIRRDYPVRVAGSATGFEHQLVIIVERHAHVVLSIRFATGVACQMPDDIGNHVA